MLRFGVLGALGNLLLICCGLVQAAPPPGYRWVSAEREQLYRRLLPPTDDPALLAIYAQHLLFYDDEVMPRAFQNDFGPALGVTTGFFSSYYNFSAVSVARGGPELYGNANREFPWGATAGMHRVHGFQPIKFCILPQPVRYWTQEFRRNSQQPRYEGLSWQFADDTVFAEVLLVSNPQGQPEPFELRLRRKRLGDWYANVYRPVRDREELLLALDDTDLDASALKQKLQTPQINIQRLRNNHQAKVVDRTAAMEELPLFPERVTKKLLQRPFRSAYNRPWITFDGVDGHAPTSRQSYGIVPAHYDGGFFRVTHAACRDCHRTTQMDTNRLQPFRDWYGQVSGSDEIVSWHLIASAAISRDPQGYLVPQLRPDMVRAGLVLPYRD